MNNIYYLFFWKKKTPYFIVNYLKKEGCKVKRITNKERDKFRDPKLKLPYVLEITWKKFKEIILADNLNLIVYLGVLHNGYWININKLKEVIRKDKNEENYKYLILQNLQVPMFNLLNILLKLKEKKDERNL